MIEKKGERGERKEDEARRALRRKPEALKGARDLSLRIQSDTTGISTSFSK
jgi:hypothetical protein